MANELLQQSKDINSPAFECAAFTEQMPALALVRDFCAGTDAVRKAGAKYLTPFPREDSDAYAYRLAQSLTFSDTEQTVQNLVGRVFRQPPKLGEDMPLEIVGNENDVEVEGWAENIDRLGTHWQVFARQAFEHAMRDGHAFIYVDMPAPVTRPDGAAPTLADERAAGLRPYWVLRTKDQALNWSTVTVNGKRTLKHITFREVTVEADGRFGEKMVTRYRVLRPGAWELWEEIETKDKKEIVKVSEGTTSLGEIPIAVIHGGKETSFLASTPSLLALAEIERSRYNLSSDYRTGIHVTIPVIVRKGADADNPVTTVGWHTIFDVALNGDAKYIESNGHGLAYYEKELAALDQRMAIFGLSLLAKPQVEMTASQAVLTDLKEQSPLATAAQSLHDALELAFGFMAKFANLKGGSVGKFDVGREFNLTPQALQSLSQVAGNGQLSKETFLKILKQSGWMPEDFDVSAEVARLDLADQQAAERQRQLFDAGNLPIDAGAGGA